MIYLKKSISPKPQTIVLIVMGLLLLVLLFLSAVAQPEISQTGNGGDYRVVAVDSCEKIAKEDAPTGMLYEFRFTLEDVHHGDTLTFFINHHNVEIYLEEECVYQLTAADGAIRTPGGVWPMIPLDETDSGKEIRVVLIPLYRDYQDETPAFLLGSALAIYKASFYQALPEMVLSLCVVLAGLFLFCMAVYSSVQHNLAPRLYAQSMLAVFTGLWRFTYGKFAYLLLENHTVFVYYLSVISLMLVALAMLNCVEVGDHKRGARAIAACSLVYCLVNIFQVLLQLAGILDLRQMLKITHAMLIASAAMPIVSNGVVWFRHHRSADKLIDRDYSWLLGIGVIIDLLLYYFAASSVGMLFTLCAILIYSMLEGVQLLIRYSRQKSELEEMNTQLMLSRTTTMMSQIRSHFVFNILNAVSGMCKYDPEKADETIVRFARYLRSNIDIMENDKNIPFTTDLKQLEDYVILEQVRFGDKLEFYTDIKEDRFMIPPLILQPVVENAIKHGISKKQSAGTIILRTHATDRDIVITVEDDGVGFDVRELSKEKSVGIRNIRFRLRYLVNGTLDITSEVGTGTTVTITIPRKEAQACASFM